MTLFSNRWILLILISCLPALAQATDPSCNSVSSRELEGFFSRQSQWTEVESSSSYNIAQSKVIRIILNFSQIQNSTVLMGRQRMGQVNQICKISGNQIKIISGNNEIIVSKVARDRIRSQMRILGRNYTYFYVPSASVIGEQLSELETESSEQSTAVM